MPGEKMLHALEAAKGEDNKLDANELREVLSKLKSGEVARGLNKKKEQIQKIDGLKDAVHQLIDEHASGNKNLPDNAVNALYTLHNAIDGGFNDKKVTRKDVSIDKDAVGEIRSKIWKDKISPLITKSNLTTEQDFWETEYTTDGQSSNVIGRVALKSGSESYFLPFNFDGTFANSETGLEVKNQSADKSLYARITKDTGNLVLEDKDTNHQWNEFLSLAKNFPQVDGIETSIGERTLFVFDMKNIDFIDTQLVGNTDFMLKNLLDGKNFSALKEEYRNKQVTLEDSQDQYNTTKASIQTSIDAMNISDYPKMSQTSFDNFKNVIKSTQLQLLDTGTVSNPPAGWNESFAGVVPQAFRGLGNKIGELKNEIGNLSGQIDDIREKFVKEHKADLIKASPTVVIGSDGKLVGSTSESTEITVGSSTETVKDYVSLNQENIIVALDDGKWTVYTRQEGADGVNSYVSGSSKPIDVTSPVVDNPKEVVSENADLNTRIDALNDGFMFNVGKVNKISALKSTKDSLKLLAEKGKIDNVTSIVSNLESAADTSVDSQGRTLSLQDRAGLIRGAQNSINELIQSSQISLPINSPYFINGKLKVDGAWGEVTTDALAQVANKLSSQQSVVVDAVSNTSVDINKNTGSIDAGLAISPDIIESVNRGYPGLSDSIGLSSAKNVVSSFIDNFPAAGWKARKLLWQDETKKHTAHVFENSANGNKFAIKNEFDKETNKVGGAFFMQGSKKSNNSIQSWNDYDRNYVSRFDLADKTSIWTAFDSVTGELSFNNKDIDTVLKTNQSGKTSAEVFKDSLDSLNGTIA